MPINWYQKRRVSGVIYVSIKINYLSCLKPYYNYIPVCDCLSYHSNSFYLICTCEQTHTHTHTHYITILSRYCGIQENTLYIKVKVPLCNNCDITFCQKALDSLIHIRSTSLNKELKKEHNCQIHTFSLSILLQNEDFVKFNSIGTLTLWLGDKDASM